MTTPGPLPLPSLKERLKAKAPEIVVEACSVVLAVLLALAVDEWREDRSHRELAARAQATILAEVRANLEELKKDRAATAKLIERLPAEDSLASGSSAKVWITISFSRLSSAAWNTAQSTQAAQYFEYSWMMRAARLYEIQSVYLATQTSVLNHIAGAIGEADKAALVRGLRSRYFVMQNLADNVLGAYTELLDQRPKE